MNLTIQRTTYTDKSTIGQMTVGNRKYFTLEPPVKHDGTKPRAIPAGSYDLTIRRSPRFARLMPHVENVPGFEGILLHIGNRPEDTEGCTLIAHNAGTLPDFVGDSRTAFDQLFAILYDASTAIEGSDARMVGTISYVDKESI